MGLKLIAILLLLGGCSLQKVALRSSTPIFEKSADGMMTEGNWDFFRKSAPGNIKMMELLWQQDKENLELLSIIVKSYAGYAFTVYETLAYQDELSGIEDSPSKKEAISYYTRALDYGLRYLEEKGITKGELLSNDENALIAELNKLGDKDVTALIYTGQAWGSLINLQKDNVALVSHVPKVKLLFDRGCKLQPDFDQNVCDIFYAQYEASRPRMLGGNPEKAEKLYLEAIEKHPMNLLIRENYIQYVLVPSMDGEKYEKISTLLKEELKKWSDLNRNNLENDSPYKSVPELNLYNATAKKRFEIIEKNKKKIF